MTRILLRGAVGCLMVLCVAAPGLMAGVAQSFDLPDTAYLSNEVIDIIGHNGGIWLATGEGLNFSFDTGKTWLIYDASNGLVSSSISAFYSTATPLGQRIWVGTNYQQRISGLLFDISEGLSYSDDNGNTWTQINFGETGLDIPYVWGGDRQIFDITGYYDPNPLEDDNWLFFSAFAGGLLASRDGGTNWRRIYSSATDSVQFNTDGVAPSLRNRYFSCQADTSHGDSLFLWAGTAGGVLEYIFAEPRDKQYVDNIRSIALCQSCLSQSDVDSQFVFYGGAGGVMRGTVQGGPFQTRFEEDGLPGPYVSAVYEYGGRVFAGCLDSDSGASAGLAISDDYGDSYSSSGLAAVVGSGRAIHDFALIRNRIYMTAEEAGLFVSADTGESWEHLFVDSSNQTAANRRNVVFGLEALGDTLRVGTDSGLVHLFMDPAGSIDSSRFHVFPESPSSSARVIKVRSNVVNDTNYIWTVHRALTGAGIPMVARSADGGVTWRDSLQPEVLTYDVNFVGDSTFAVGEAGARYSESISNPTNVFSIREIVSSTVIDSLDGRSVTTMEVFDDTLIFFGSDSGFAVSTDRLEFMNVFRVNRDSLHADAVLNFTSSVVGLTGDFIPALAVQYRPDEPAWVWVSMRPALSGSPGIALGVIDTLIFDILDTAGAVIRVDTLVERVWGKVYDDYAWNFAFHDEWIFAATNDGLLYSDTTRIFDSLDVWDTLTVLDTLGYPLVFPGTPYYAVEVVNDRLWIGTGDRSVSVDIEDFGDGEAYYVSDTLTPPSEVYAYPVPFSHVSDGFVDFRFVVARDATITLEIYDFAMNLVSRLIDNEFFAADYYPTAGFGRRTWDGTNEKGDRVAVGMYYFKVTYSTGETRWGKLAVIP